jgi:hypothetical protein
MSMVKKWWKEIKAKDKINVRVKAFIVQLRPEILAVVKQKLNDHEAEKLTGAIIEVLNKAVDKVF